MRVSKTKKPLDFTERFRDVPLTVEDYLRIKDSITRERRWYLIGKFCEREKYELKNGEYIQELLTRLGQGFGCSEPAIRRLVSYYKAIDYLQSVAPDIVSDILSGKLRMSVENVRNLAKRPRVEIREIVERVKLGEERLYEIFPERRVTPEKEPRGNQRKLNTGATVKDTPKYDPDAQVTGLTYTIPSWVTAIERVFMSDHLRKISKLARKKLIKELSLLRDTTDLMAELLSEEGCRRGRL